MKTFFASTCLISSLFLMTSCGGQKTAAQLEITQGFAMANPTFAGGLIISGTRLNSTDSFSQGITNNSSVKLSLNPGKWTFTAIAWDGGGSAGNEKLFAGVPYCGMVTQDLFGSSASISLSISKANCGGPEFAGTLADTTSLSHPTLPVLSNISTCNSFFTSVPQANDNNPTNTFLVNSSTPIGYCNDSLPVDMNSRVYSMKIHSWSKTPEDTKPSLGLSSPCIESNSANNSAIDPSSLTPANPYGASYPLRLPLKGVPLAVTLYERTDCTEPLARYEFSNGIQTKSLEFDHMALMKNSGPSIKLVLPSNDLKRALSPFQHLLPFFKDSTNNPFPTGPAGLPDEYHAFIGETSYIRVERDACPQAADYGSHVNLSALTCTQINKRKIEYSFVPSAANASIVILSPTSEVINIQAEASSNFTRYHSNATLWKLLGAPGSVNSYESFFQNGSGDHDNEYGALTQIRNMLAGNGAGGVLGIQFPNLSFKANCQALAASAPVEKEVSIFNFQELSTERYKVRISSSPSRTPSSYLCEASNFDSDCGSGKLFNKRMMIWDYKNDLVNPHIVMEFSCDELLGKFESVMGDKNGTMRRIVNWNTSTTSGNAYQRFETLTHFIQNSNGAVVAEKKSISRIEKYTDGDNFNNWNFEYSTRFNGSTWDEVLIKNEQMTNGGTMDFRVDTETLSSATRGGIFDNGGTSALRTELPSSTQVTDYYNVTATFPQAIGASPGYFLSDLTGTTNSGDLVDGSLVLQLESLKDSNFLNHFGGTFYKAP